MDCSQDTSLKSSGLTVMSLSQLSTNPTFFLTLPRLAKKMVDVYLENMCTSR